jgi:hypothetical protein
MLYKIKESICFALPNKLYLYQMKFNLRNTAISFTVLLLTFFYSCKKHLPPCSGNCAAVVFSGMVYDKTSNQPLSNQNLTINLYQNSYCIICSSYKLASGKSGDDGHFLFNTEIDTTLLKTYHIGFNVSVTSNYILNAEPVGPGISQYPTSSSISFYSIDRIAMQNLNFGFYPKTLLHINLHRITPIIPQYPTLDLEFSFDNQLSIWGLAQSNNNKDTTLTINTTANIFTRIISRKFISTTNVISNTDSIKCTTTGNNSIDISY